jgi:hypothetical protein
MGCMPSKSKPAAVPTDTEPNAPLPQPLPAHVPVATLAEGTLHGMAPPSDGACGAGTAYEFVPSAEVVQQAGSAVRAVPGPGNASRAGVLVVLHQSQAAARMQV